MSRQELADAVNAHLAGRTSRLTDAKHIGKLERGEHRWPVEEYRKALRAVLNVATDTELGFYIIRGRTAQRQISLVADDRPMADTAYHSRIVRQHDLVRSAGAAWFGMLPDELLELPGPWTTGAETPARIEQAHVDALKYSLAQFERRDHQFGGGPARTAMAGQMDWVCRAARQSAMTDKVRRAWLSTAARLGDLISWLGLLRRG